MKHRPQILIIDDEPSARHTLEMLLLRETYELILVGSGPEAFVELEEIDPDVILLDVMMPGMDGFEVCQRLKANPARRHIPIILVTALDTKEELARGIDAGADDFLHKPVNGLELRARVRSMLRIKQRHDVLQNMLQLREVLSNMIVHDIRGPLANIQVYCDLLEDKVTPDGIADLATIRGAARRLSSFLTDMLMVAKMDQGRMLLHCEDVDINKLLRDVHSSFHGIARAMNVHFDLEIPEENRHIPLDRNLWRRMLDNLLSNAFKFSPGAGAVTLRATFLDEAAESDDAKAPSLRIQVVDEGPGIPTEHHHAVFQKFQVVAAQRQDVKQVGLGLAFCKMVVEAHNGRIFIENNHPTGAIIVVEV